MKRLVVLASGRGSNFKAILDEIEAGHINGKIVAVISDHHDAKALDTAREHEIEAIYGNAKNPEYNEWLIGKVKSYAPDYVLLAGYMRIVPPEFVAALPIRLSISILHYYLPLRDFTASVRHWNMG